MNEYRNQIRSDSVDDRSRPVSRDGGYKLTDLGDKAEKGSRSKNIGGVAGRRGDLSVVLFDKHYHTRRGYAIKLKGTTLSGFRNINDLIEFKEKYLCK